MKHFLRYALAAIVLCLLPVSAQAATCYWFYGGVDHNYSTSGNWWTLDSHAVSCVATGGYPHSSGDIANLDASSGSDTVIQDVDIALGVSGAINATGFTGGWDDSANHNVTANTVNFSTGNPSVTMGSGTWAQSGTTGGSPSWTFTTTGSFSGASATIAMTACNGIACQGTLNGGSHTFGSLTIAAANSGAGGYNFSVSATFVISCTISPRANIAIANSATLTCPTVTLVGTASEPINFLTGSGTGAAVSFVVGAGSTCAYCAFRGITSSNMAATCSFDLGGNTLGSISNSCGGGGGGGGGHIIGG